MPENRARANRAHCKRVATEAKSPPRDVEKKDGRSRGVRQQLQKYAGGLIMQVFWCRIPT